MPRRLFQQGFALLACTLIGASPGPRPSRILWDNVAIVFFPDSLHGVLIWVDVRPEKGDEPVKPSSQYIAHFRPDRTTQWVEDARAFDSQRLTDSDSGQYRTSPPLASKDSDAIVVVRRRVGGRWSDERLLTLKSR